MSIKNNTTSLQNLLDAVNALPDAGGTGGVELPELTNEGNAANLFSGKQLIDGDGNVVTGTFTIDSELETQDDLISQIQTVLSNKAGGVVLPKLSNPATAENLEEGYELIDGDGNIVVGTHVCSGSSGGSIDVCTVTAGADEASSILGVRMINGLPVPIYQDDSAKALTWEAPCGSIVAIAYPLGNNCNCVNATYLGYDDGTYATSYCMGYLQPVHLFRIDAKAGETASIEMYEILS